MFLCDFIYAPLKARPSAAISLWKVGERIKETFVYKKIKKIYENLLQMTRVFNKFLYKVYFVFVMKIIKEIL